MTMHLARDPLSPAYPAARAIEILTAEEAANVVDRSPWTLRAWADPTREACPNQTQGRELDRACMAKAQVAPFAEWYRSSKLIERQDTDTSLLERVLEVGANFGLLQRAAKNVGQVDKLSPNQKDELYAAYREFREATTQVETKIICMQLREPIGVDQ